MPAASSTVRKQELVTHVVVFKFNSKFDPQTATTLLANMRKGVPGLVSLDFGPVNTAPFKGYADRSGGYTHVLVSKHTDTDALKIYQDHPVHLVLVKYLRSVMADKPMAFDVTSHL